MLYDATMPTLTVDISYDTPGDPVTDDPSGIVTVQRVVNGMIDPLPDRFTLSGGVGSILVDDIGYYWVHRFGGSKLIYLDHDARLDEFASLDPATLIPTPDVVAAWDAAIAEQDVGLAVPPLIDVTEELVGADPWPVAVLDGVLWGATENYHLWSSTDSGVTWTDRAFVNTATSPIRRLLAVADGEVLVHCLGEVIRSTGWTTPNVATWARNLTPLHAGTYFAEWSVDAAGAIAIAAEYGSHSDHPWACWVSTDAGQTWVQRLDLGAIYPVPQQGQLHFHGCAVDTFRGLVWAVNGDSADVCRLRWSADNGVTWHDTTDPLSQARITTILPMPEGIILGGDSGGADSPDGTYRMRPDLSRAEVSHMLDMGVGGATHVANGATRDPVGGIGWTTLQGWQGKGFPGVIIGSVNGRVSNEVWRDPTPHPTDDNERKPLWAFGPDRHGVLHVRLGSVLHHGWHMKARTSPPGVPEEQRAVLEGRRYDRSSTAASPSSQAGPFSTAIGAEAEAGTGTGASGGSTAIGAGASAGTTADSGDSTAIGRDAKTNGFGSTAIGAGAEANSGVAVGNEATATGAGATAMGNLANAPSDLSTAVGTSAFAQYFASTLLGYGAVGTSAFATAIGQGAQAFFAAVALGYGAIADQERSVALGSSTNTTAPDQVEIGQRHIELGPVTAEPGPPTAAGRFFVRDNGAGKMQLCVKFPTGAVAVIATEP